MAIDALQRQDKLRFEYIPESASLTDIIRIINESFDQVKQFGGGDKGDSITGDRGLPGRNIRGTQGEQGPRGGQIEYTASIVQDGDTFVSETTGLQIGDTLVDADGKLFKMVDNGILGEVEAEFTVDLRSVSEGDAYIQTQGDYNQLGFNPIDRWHLRDAGIAVGETLVLAYRDVGPTRDTSELYRLAIGDDGKVDINNTSLSIANIIPRDEDALSAKDDFFAQLSLKYRPRIDSEVSAFSLYHRFFERNKNESAPVATDDVFYQIDNTSVGWLMKHDTTSSSLSRHVVRGRNVTFIGDNTFSGAFINGDFATLDNSDPYLDYAINNTNDQITQTSSGAWAVTRFGGGYTENIFGNYSLSANNMDWSTTNYSVNATSISLSGSNDFEIVTNQALVTASLFEGQFSTMDIDASSIQIDATSVFELNGPGSTELSLNNQVDLISTNGMIFDSGGLINMESVSAINLIAGGNITATSQSITFDQSVDFNVRADDDIDLDANDDVSIQAGGTMTLEGAVLNANYSGPVTIVGSSITLDGPVTLLNRISGLSVGGSQLWEPTGSDGPIFEYLDSNTSYNGFTMGGIVATRADAADLLLFTSRAFGANVYVQAPRYYLGSSLGNGTEIVDNNRDAFFRYVNTERISSSSNVGFFNGNAAQGILTGTILVSHSYSDVSNVPANGMWVKGSIVTAEGFVSGITIANSSGNLFAQDSLTLRRDSNNIAGIYWPSGSGSNDPARIEHSDNSNVGIMTFSCSDDPGDSDYFTFGTRGGSSYVEGLRITGSGRIFKNNYKTNTNGDWYWNRLTGHTTITAGTGLTGGGNLSADRSISIANGGVDTTQLADNAVTAAKIGNDQVTREKINANVAGNGLGQDANGALTVRAGNGIEITSDAVAVDILFNSGLAFNSGDLYVNAGSGLTRFGGQVIIADGGVTPDKLDQSVTYEMAELLLTRTGRGGGLQYGNNKQIYSTSFFSSPVTVNLLKMENDAFIGGISLAAATIYFQSTSQLGDTASSNIRMIPGSGNITCVSLTQTSDERYKVNIKDLSQDKVNDTIDRARPVEFEWDREGLDVDGVDVGLIAQEFKDIAPELVVYSEAEDEYSIKYDKLITYLIKYSQNLKKEIEILKKK